MSKNDEPTERRAADYGAGGGFHFLYVVPVGWDDAAVRFTITEVMEAARVEAEARVAELKAEFAAAAGLLKNRQATKAENARRQRSGVPLSGRSEV